MNDKHTVGMNVYAQKGEYEHSAAFMCEADVSDVRGKCLSLKVRRVSRRPSRSV